MSGRTALPRALVVLGLALGLGSGLLGPARAQAAEGVLAVGDSVMLGAKWQLQRNGVAVDAKESRFPRAGVDVVRSRTARTKPTDVVIHMGTNGQLSERDCRALVRAASGAERVHLVTIKAPRDYARRNNAVIRSCAAGFPASRVHVIDWARAASVHPSWLYSDGIHLRPAGAKAFARLVLGSIERARARS